jgi:hypothetical protein
LIEKKILSPIELVKYQSQIANLFEICFNEGLDSSLWKWAYLDNPIGDPIIAVAHEDGCIVAHYAMIRMPFVENSNPLEGYLSMTTMVHPDFRKYGLFVELANLTYSQASKNSFVYGFPNANSLPGFKKRLEWMVSTDYCIASIDEHLLPMYQSTLESEKSKGIELDLSNPEFLAWRLSKPGCEYKSEGSLIYKEHKGAIDLMNIDIENLPYFYKSQKVFNILSNDESLVGESNSFQPYNFGVRSLGANINLELFRPTLIMSDVF